MNGKRLEERGIIGAKKEHKSTWNKIPNKEQNQPGHTKKKNQFKTTYTFPNKIFHIVDCLLAHKSDALLGPQY